MGRKVRLMTYPHLFEYWIRDDGLYEAHLDYVYRSARYNREVKILAGQVRDGASGAIDITSLAWWVHDQLCADGYWSDGSPVTRTQAATVLHDILMEEGREIRAKLWWIATWLLGCHKVRKNRLKNG